MRSLAARSGLHATDARVAKHTRQRVYTSRHARTHAADTVSRARRHCTPGAPADHPGEWNLSAEFEWMKRRGNGSCCSVSDTHARDIAKQPLTPNHVTAYLRHQCNDQPSA